MERSRVDFFAVKNLLALLLSVIRLLPAKMLPGLATLLTLLSKPFSRRDRRRLEQNIHQIWGLPPGSHFGDMFAKQVSRLQILTALETIKSIQHPGQLAISGLDELKFLVAKAEAAGKGHILVTAHLGSWELCAYFGAQAATRQFHVLAKPSRHVAVTKALDDLRLKMGTKVLWTDRKSILREMLGAIKKAESVGFVMDQKPEGRKGPVVTFFDLPTEFVSGPANLAIKTGCAVIAIFCVREGSMRYRILAEELAPASHGEQDEIALTQKMAIAIEEAIRFYPEQWTWNYKRWRFDQPAVSQNGPL